MQLKDIIGQDSGIIIYEDLVNHTLVAPVNWSQAPDGMMVYMPGGMGPCYACVENCLEQIKPPEDFESTRECLKQLADNAQLLVPKDDLEVGAAIAEALTGEHVPARVFYFCNDVTVVAPKGFHVRPPKQMMILRGAEDDGRRR